MGTPLNISIEKWSDFKFNDKQENNAGAELIRNVVLAGIITPRVWGLGVESDFVIFALYLFGRTK